MKYSNLQCCVAFRYAANWFNYTYTHTHTHISLHIHYFIFFSIIDIEYTSLFDIVSPCWLSTLYVGDVYFNPQFLICLSHISSLVTIVFFLLLCLWVYFCFVNKFFCIFFFRFHLKVILFVFLCLTCFT